MSDTSGQNEPSMEEILASIRRIISEDNADRPAAAAAPAARPTPVPAAEPAGEVLVLTEVVAEDGSVTSLGGSAAEARAAAPERRGSVLEAAEPAPARPAPRGRVEPAATLPTTVEEPAPAVPPRTAEPGGLLSRKTAAAAATAFAQLSTAIPKDGPSASGGPTLEAFVRQALEPMLREWLDANLPGIIERLVREEIERVVRSGGRF